MAGESFDFLNPFMRAAIITDPMNRDFTRYPLWTFDRMDSQSPGPLRSREMELMGSLAFVSEIKVKLNLSYCPTITVTLTPSFEAARRFIDSPLIEYGMTNDRTSMIEVQFGYASPAGVVVSPMFEGMLLKPEVSLGVDVSITLNAQGIGGVTATRQETGDVFNDVSLQDVFTTLCQKHGMILDTSELEANGSEELKAFTKKQQSFVPGNVSDWYFLVREAANIGCWVYLDSSDGQSKLKILSMDGVYGSKPVYQFRLFDFPQGVIGPKNGVFPILGISTPTSAIYLAAVSQQIRMMGTDSATRETVVTTVNDKSASPKRVEEGQAGPVAPTEKSGSFLPLDAGKPASISQAEAAFKASQNNMGTKIDVQTLGIPNLRPGQVVSIAGVSKTRIDGNYAIFEVEHTLGTGGFETSFTAYKNVGNLSQRLNSGIQAVDANPNKFNNTNDDLARTHMISLTPDDSQGVA